MTRSSAPPPALRASRLTRTGFSALVTMAAGVALALVAAPASAHDELSASTPADGETLASPPARVVLTFAEPPVELGAQLVVTGPDGPVTSGAPRLAGDDVVVDLQPSAPAGRYSVEWRVTSDDGHPVSGSFGFTARAAAASASAPAPTGSAVTPAPVETSRRQPLVPSWAWIVAGVIVIAGAIRLNRRAKSAQKED